MNLQYLLLDDKGWASLEGMLKGKSNSPISSNVISQLRLSGAKSAIIEHDYLDRDFTEMYSYFYSRTFKRYTKICKRIFVFSDLLTPNLFSVTPPGDLPLILEGLGSDSIISIIILRPVAESPISAISSSVKKMPDAINVDLLIASTLEHHISGATIKLSANTMTQQDTRVGSCAQAAIWNVARHFRLRHKGPWVSTPEITNLATSRADFSLSKTLPIGSDFLPVNDMVHTLKAIGREPYGYCQENNNIGGYSWLSVNPVEVIHRYIDSGIPLILGIAYPDGNIGHALVATGRVRSKDTTNVVDDRRTTSEFYSHLLVNDDQSGPNLYMSNLGTEGAGPSGHSLTHNGMLISIKDNLQYIIVPLPDKVYFPAEIAENNAWAQIEHYLSVYEIRVKEQSAPNERVKHAYEAFSKAKTSGNLVIRTYLTYGWKHKQRALRNNLPDVVKVIIRDLDLPKYVWVTEIGTFDSLSSGAHCERTIFSHVVVDATAKNSSKESVLFFHAPGYCMYHKHVNTSEGLTELQENFLLCPDFSPYFPKKRGRVDFEDSYNFQKTISPP